MKARDILPNRAICETAKGHKMVVQHDLTATTAEKRTEHLRTPVTTVSFMPAVELLPEQTVYE